MASEPEYPGIPRFDHSKTAWLCAPRSAASAVKLRSIGAAVGGSACPIRASRDTERCRAKRPPRSANPLPPPVAVPANRGRLAELRFDVQEHGFVLAVDGRDRFEGENEPPSEQSSAHDELVGMVGVAFVANVVEAREGAPLLVQDEVARGRGKQPAGLAPLSKLILAARFRVVHELNQMQDRLRVGGV